jgi:hypothetical protein
LPSTLPRSKNTPRVGAATERCGDPRCQAVAGGRAEYQYVLRPCVDGALLGDVIDLLLDVGFATNRMGRHTDKAANAGFDDHTESPNFNVPGANKGGGSVTC